MFYNILLCYEYTIFIQYIYTFREYISLTFTFTPPNMFPILLLKENKNINSIIMKVEL